MAEIRQEKGDSPLPENDPVDVPEVLRLAPDGERVVRGVSQSRIAALA